MANEMTLLSALAGAGQTIMSMTQTGKTKRAVRKQDSIALQEQIRFIKAACRIRGVSELTRQGLDELEKTAQRIDQNRFSEGQLHMALELLNIQFRTVRYIIEHYDGGLIDQ
ncbi:MAG: hypothetical protein J1E00_01030 [Oscillospiraceae bacterium]|nr:hypothetical protein [Oscillospiraceae bacterium]